METLGKTLKIAREKASLTLREIDQLTGISNAYLSQLENDKIKKPSASVLYKLSSVYKMELDDLLSAAGIIQNRVKKDDDLSLLEKEIAFYKDQLSDDEQNQIISFMKFLKSNK